MKTSAHLIALVGLLTALLSNTANAVTAVRNPILNADPAQYLDKIVLPEGFRIEL